MAIDSAARRYSMMNLGTGGVSIIAPIPDGSNWDGAQRLHGVGLYFGSEPEEPSEPPAVTGNMSRNFIETGPKMAFIPTEIDRDL